MKKFAFGLLTLVWLAACTTPNIVVSEDLKSDTEVLEVKGTQGWQINKVIRFGEYHTSKVKKGWTRITNARFISHFKKASQKLTFTQFTPAGDQADVFAIGQFRSNELELLRGWFSYELDYENYFSGSILTHNNEWDFIFFDPEGGTRSADGSFECGEIRRTTGDII